MRVDAAVFVLCLGAVEAQAHPSDAEPAPAPPAPIDAPTLGVEVAGTWSGKTIEPETGWRAAILVPLKTKPLSNRAHDTWSVAFIARFDNHGAPAEHGDPKTTATSWGGGLRATALWAASSFRIGVFTEGTVGRTRARHADQMTSQRDGHWMLSGGLVGGSRSVQVVADFGWLVTDAGDGRIGPIASLGLHVAIE